MSTLQITVTRQLARSVRFTEKLKTRPAQSRIASAVSRAVDFFARGTFYVWRNRKYLTTIKLANMALVNLQFWLKTEYVLGRPYTMKIESTNICNTKCQLCPTGLGLEGRKKGKMSMEQYKRLIDKTKRHLFSLDLSMWGDPLIVPDIYDMIRYAHDRGIWTYISSNLHAFKLTPKPGEKSQAEKLVESGLDMLTCSLHGASQATYERYQPGKNYDEAVAKVRHIIETRNRMGSSTPAIQLNYVVTKHNEHERAAFQQLADELGCKAIFSNASMNIRFLGKNQQLHSLGLAPDVLEKKVKAHLEHWLPTDQEFVLKPYQDLMAGRTTQDEAFNGKKLMDCSWPWRASVVNWDGEVVTCCGSFETNEDMGSVFEQNFSKIWNGQKYRMARRSFKKKLTAEQAENNPCATCPGFML
jgi:radical SAM protein with 4Fe4S-binding SPASM domain